MANEEHLKILKRGAAIWNQWRKNNPNMKPDLELANLYKVNLYNADLSNTNLSNAELSYTEFSNANFSHANLVKANFYWANLSRANIREADLSNANLSEANLSEADFYYSNLSEANLRGSTLNNTKLYWANLCRANLCHANLVEAKLHSADLSNADLKNAILVWANLSGTNLYNADLSKADLSNTIFDMANLSGANLENSLLFDTIFANTNLKDAKGLDKCTHWGPSTIDNRTLQHSYPLPLVFLRGCGLSDIFIDYLPSLLEQPWQYYSCFISYSSKDREAARRLYADLQDNGVRCWLDEHDMKGGKKTYLQIDEAIRIHDRVLLVLSENSMESEWVITEIRKALALEKSKQQDVLFPIRLVDMDKIKAWECFDSDTGVDLAKKVREYFIPDFHNWKDHGSYHKSFDKLLSDLKSPNKKTKPTD